MSKKITGYIILIVVLVIGFFLGSNFGCSGSQIKTSLDRCLSAGISKGIFSDDAVKDSALISKCDRFHREQLVDKYLFTVKKDKEGNIIGRKQKINKDESRFSKSEILLFIENGAFQRK